MPDPQYFYRVLPNGTGWYWEIVDSENGVVERGVASGRVRARVDALKAAFDLLATVPDPYPEDTRCPNSFST